MGHISWFHVQVGGVVFFAAPTPVLLFVALRLGSILASLCGICSVLDSLCGTCTGLGSLCGTWEVCCIPSVGQVCEYLHALPYILAPIFAEYGAVESSRGVADGSCLGLDVPSLANEVSCAQGEGQCGNAVSCPLVSILILQAQKCAECCPRTNIRSFCSCLQRNRPSGRH